MYVVVYVVIVRYRGYVMLERWRDLISWCLHWARFPTRLGMCIEGVVRGSFPRTAIAGLEGVRQLLPGGQMYAGEGVTVPMVTSSCCCAWKCISRSHRCSSGSECVRRFYGVAKGVIVTSGLIQGGHSSYVRSIAIKVEGGRLFALRSLLKVKPLNIKSLGARSTADPARVRTLF